MEISQLNSVIKSRYSLDANELKLAAKDTSEWMNTDLHGGHVIALSHRILNLTEIEGARAWFNDKIIGVHQYSATITYLDPVELTKALVEADLGLYETANLDFRGGEKSVTPAVRGFEMPMQMQYSWGDLSGERSRILVSVNGIAEEEIRSDIREVADIVHFPEWDGKQYFNKGMGSGGVPQIYFIRDFEGEINGNTYAQAQEFWKDVLDISVKHDLIGKTPYGDKSLRQDFIERGRDLDEVVSGAVMGTRDNYSPLVKVTSSLPTGNSNKAYEYENISLKTTIIAEK